MKTCPVCNDSFADQLNFCDIDGARLTREGSLQERNKWWSLLGAGLLVGALVITAASIFFLPKARVSAPIGSSDSQASPTPPSAPSAESSATVASAPPVSAEPESVPSAIIPEVKKKDKALANENVSGATPNPKAAALAAEGADKKPATIEAKEPSPPVQTRPEASSSAGSDDDSRSDSAKPQPPPDLKKDTKNPPTIAKGSDKDSNDKKKNDDKDKKKGGFLRVFKKIFGKD